VRGRARCSGWHAIPEQAGAEPWGAQSLNNFLLSPSLQPRHVARLPAYCRRRVLLRGQGPPHRAALGDRDVNRAPLNVGPWTPARKASTAQLASCHLFFNVLYLYEITKAPPVAAEICLRIPARCYSMRLAGSWEVVRRSSWPVIPTSSHEGMRGVEQ
jgi:hypothetical protein